MGTSKEYDSLVEGFRAKISGNVSSVKMTEADTAKEIADIQAGAVSTFEGKYEIGQDGKTVTVTIPPEIMPPQYIYLTNASICRTYDIFEGAP